jgi:hypothetical protein
MGVEDVLVLRVVDEARRRRVRRGVVAALLLLVTGSGVAVGLTHRSGAVPSAAAPSVTDRVADLAQRSAIYAAARARYAGGLAPSGPNTHLEFGRLTINGASARLLVNFVCIPLCGHGEELSLAKIDGVWRVVAVRTSWLSWASASHRPAS